MDVLIGPCYINATTAVISQVYDVLMLIIYIGLIEALGLLVLNNIELSNFDVSSLDVLRPENSSESLKVVFYSYGLTLIVMNLDL